MTTTTTLSTDRPARAGALAAATLAFAFGAGLVFFTGFAGAGTLHNAAHDTRHALSFPCH